jgi:hypothetical protein
MNRGISTRNRTYDLGHRGTDRRGFLALVGVATTLALIDTLPAAARPEISGSRAAVQLVDGWDRQLDLANFARPIVLFYEDKDSSTQNQTIKDELTDFQRSSNYRATIEHIIVADTSAYNYWPAKGIAKGELRKWTMKLGIIVYSDFIADVRMKLELEKGQSNVVLYGADGRVLLAHAGPMPRDVRDELIARMKELL